MRTILYVSILVLLISGCKNKTDNFQTIDYSCFVDPANIFSIKISSDGRANLYTYNKYWDSKYYHDLTLERAVLDSLSKLTKLIMDTKFDSTYSFDCDRCLSYCLIIKTKKQDFKVTYHGQLFTDKSLILLDRFSRNINLIVQDRQKSIDSIYRFDSWSKYLLPPPPPSPFDSAYEACLKEYLPNCQ